MSTVFYSTCTFHRILQVNIRYHHICDFWRQCWSLSIYVTVLYSTYTTNVARNINIFLSNCDGHPALHMNPYQMWPEILLSVSNSYLAVMHSKLAFDYTLRVTRNIITLKNFENWLFLIWELVLTNHVWLEIVLYATRNAHF